MKNKKSIYILLPVVLMIWGLVIYRFFSFSGPEEVVTPNNVDLSLKSLAIKENDSIKIDVNYRDPFLGKMYNPANAQKKNYTVTRPKIEESVIWPNVVYKGIVSDTKDKNKVFMVIINGRTFLMKEKDQEQEMTLKSGNREYIEIQYKGDVTQILIQE